MTLSDERVYHVSFNLNDIMFGVSKGNIFNELKKLKKKPLSNVNGLSSTKWYKLAEFTAKSSANATIVAIASGKRPIPSGRFEFTARCPTKDSSVLYARYIVEV